MADYKQMYLTMLRASERAINLLIEAQREAEELYIAAEEEAMTAADEEEV